METEINALYRIYKINNFTTNCVYRYLLKVKPHKQHILKSVVTVFHYATEE